jgi:hypothetical protein
MPYLRLNSPRRFKALVCAPLFADSHYAMGWSVVQLVEELRQFGSLVEGAAGSSADNPIATSSLERIELQVNMLVGRRHGRSQAGAAWRRSVAETSISLGCETLTVDTSCGRVHVALWAACSGGSKTNVYRHAIRRSLEFLCRGVGSANRKSAGKLSRACLPLSTNAC